MGAVEQTQIEEVHTPVRLPVEGAVLSGDMYIPSHAAGMVVFAHGSGSGRFSPRNRYVASVLHRHALGTLLIDLLTPDEERLDVVTREHRFNIPLLAGRLASIADWIRGQPELAHFPLGYFGSSTGGGAALIAAATRPEQVKAVVSRGGRPDLAGNCLPRVRAPTLLLVGEWDEPVIELNEAAKRRMKGTVELAIVPRATHLFEEPGALEMAARLAAEWFGRYLAQAE